MPYLFLMGGLMIGRIALTLPTFPWLVTALLTAFICCGLAITGGGLNVFCPEGRPALTFCLGGGAWPSGSGRRAGRGCCHTRRVTFEEVMASVVIAFEVAGIAIENHNLRPGESTSIYVIRRGGAR